MKIGVVLEALHLPLREALPMVKKLGAQGVQIYATGGELSPDRLLGLPDRIAEVFRMLEENGLELSALCGDFGGRGFAVAEDNPFRIEKTKRIIDLAQVLGVSVVTTHVGALPEDEASEVYQTILKAMRECGSYAAKRGVTLAIETGPETAEVLATFVERAGEGISVNMDPANFIMARGEDPAKAALTLGKYIVHTHLKDGMTKQWKETPIGDGDVNFEAYVKALREIGYCGYLTVEREGWADPVAAVRQAIDYAKAHFIS